MKKLKTCIIGCGNIFPMHAVSVTRCPETELVAVCDVKEDRAKAKAEEFGCKYYLDYKEMIDKEQPDVVHLCLPHYLHPIVAIYCEERGINVLTEKPMSIELKDAKIVISCSNKKRGLGDSKYNERRAECEKALEEIQQYAGVKSLGELTEEERKIVMTS